MGRKTSSRPNRDFETIPYVLAGRYRGAHFSNYGNAKATFDAKLPSMPQWGLHDLRRTGATLLQRLNFSREVIDACRNHRPSGVSLIYQRYAFRTEKEAQAFEALARELRTASRRTLLRWCGTRLELGKLKPDRQFLILGA